MSASDDSTKVAQELRLLFLSYPNIKLEELARNLETDNTCAPDSWETFVEPILNCASAFGPHNRNFECKQEAIELLNREFGVPTSWINLSWTQLPSVVAFQLLIAGPDSATDLVRKYRLKTTPPAQRKAPKKPSSTAAGIIAAEET